MREVANRLHLATSTVYGLCQSGELEHYRISNAIRVPKSALGEFLAKARSTTQETNADPARDS